ncbi:protein kinase domain-containing protein [Hyalangium minutum]|uniref:Serine/threonine protein kinase PrkC, regulator of stationary phase n=1 Tax=Hyalangium minutum TaxID=394096 RepID=A0A085W4U3_9BACT|nr:protein kinase [Hyalangium minutum]KFE62706.1 Serine/threonine protein kinase PrkC, regulator of stationary phase [Hyalangium minutum]
MGLRPGDRFGRYELVSRLGHGGMAETWRARLLAAAGITKPVLIKRILPEYGTDDAFISMFISEARISATLSHGNIAQVHDFGELDGEYFLAMEYVDGQPLHRILKRARVAGFDALPLPLATFIALEMCRGLHYAHTRTDDSGKPLGIVHRDISPDNVLVSYEGQVKLVDFGIAKARLQRGFSTEPGVVKGKYLFFSPEQARGEEVDGRTDVWATAVVLYEMLCGRLPVEGPEYAALPKLLAGAFPRPSMLRSEIPRELDALVMKALALNKAQRFESSHAFGDALTGYLYSSTPRFSTLTLSHFVQELFREDLAKEGRAVQVPASFLSEMEQWLQPPTSPSVPPVTLPSAARPSTEPEGPPSTDPREVTQPVSPAVDRFIPTRVKARKRRSRTLAVLLLSGGVAAGLTVASVLWGQGSLAAAEAWVQAHLQRPPEAPKPPVTAAPSPETPARTGDTPPAPTPSPPRPQTATPPPPKGSTPGTTTSSPEKKPPAPTRPDTRAAWVLLENARALIGQGKFPEAKETLERCLEVDPHLAECRRQYANVLMQLGERVRAKEQMEQFLHTPPSERPSDLPSRSLQGFSGSQQQP